MIYIDRSLFSSLVSGDQGRWRSNLSDSQVYVRVGDKIIKYSPGAFSILSLFTLAACGGGGSKTNASLDPGTINGAVIKGPVQGAIAFIDADGDGLLNTATEAYAFTDADGNYSIDTTTSGDIIVITDDTKILGGALSVSAVDTSSGSALTGVTLKAPAGASVVTPTTTLVTELGGDASAVADALGLSGVDLLNYNPYADGVAANDETALAVEKIQTQIVTTVKAMAAAAEGQNVDKDVASATAFSSMATFIGTKSSTDKMDFTDAGDLDAVVTAVANDLATKVAEANPGTATAADDFKASGAVSALGTGGALKAVNDEIEKIDDLDAGATTNILSAASRLAGEVKVSSAGWKRYCYQ